MIFSGYLELNNAKLKGEPLDTLAGVFALILSGGKLALSKSSTEVPYGLCHCGCGLITAIATRNRLSQGSIKGRPMRYISGHNAPQRAIDFLDRPHKNMRRCVCGGWKTRGVAQCRDCWNKEGKPPEDPKTYDIDGKPCRRIPLTQDQYALVDAHNYERMMQFHYFAHWSSLKNAFYAKRSVSIGNCQSEPVSMQYDVLEVSAGYIIDHINSMDTLNNCEHNLRAATKSQNAFNRKRYSNNSTGRKNISKSGNRFRVRVMVNGKSHYLGTALTFELACALQEAGVKRLHGEFASIG